MQLELLYFLVIAGGLAAALALESVRPRHAWPARERWTHFGVNMVVWALGVAIATSAWRWFYGPIQSTSVQLEVGLLRREWIPYPLAFALTFVVADLVDYVFHRASHRFRPLWLLHSVHHSDPRLDASTLFRQHPLFPILAFGVRALLVMALGGPLLALLVRDLLAIGVGYLHHAAYDWSAAARERFERHLAWLVVPPTAHWVHHDPREQYTNSNYGQLLSVWDRLFGTYVPGTAATPRSGLEALDDRRWQTVAGLLMTPWWARRIDRL